MARSGWLARRLAPVVLLALAGGVLAPRLRADDSGERIFKLDPKKLVPAERHERPVFLVATAPWTRASKRFLTETLGRADVRAALERDWLCARVEAPLEDELARTYGITVFPAVVVLDRLGGFVERIDGERPADVLQVELAQALSLAKDQEAETRAALDSVGGGVTERLERARLLVRRGLAAKAIPGLEALVAMDPEDREGAGLFALAKLASIAFRSGDLVRGDAGLARVSSMASGSAFASELRRERVHALRAARRFAEAREELARIAGSPGVPDDEREMLALEEAAVLRDEGRADEARAKLEELWDRAGGPARLLAEAALDADPGAPGRSDWKTLRDGRLLVQRMGCAECHSIERSVALDLQASCTRCHQKIVAGFGTVAERADALALDPGRYSAERNIRHYLFAPDLSTVTVRLRREWLRSFIRHPADVRPFLQESMPRLPLTDPEIELVLDYLDVVGKRAVGVIEGAKILDGDPAVGEKLFQAKGCQACHVFGNRVFPDSPPAEPWPRTAPPNIQRAPNLRWARERARREVLPLWIRQPRRFVPGTPMPSFDLTDQEVGDLVAFLEKGDRGKPAPFAWEPVLPAARAAAARPEEVREIFLDTCKHCHLRDEAGGIGNAGGGFGYAPRGLDLETESGPLRGSLGKGARRASILVAREGEREAPLLMRLLWRRDENRWDAWPPYKDPLIPIPTERYDHPPGMPLGLPALDDGDAALLGRFVEERGAKPR